MLSTSGLNHSLSHSTISVFLDSMATMRSKLLQLRGLNALNLEQHKPRIDMGWTQGAGDAKLGFLVNMIGIGAFAGCALGLGALLPKPVSLGIAAAALALPTLRALLVQAGIKTPRALLTPSQNVPIAPGRTAAQIEGDFVVFLIGMRVNMGLHASLEDFMWIGASFEAMMKELKEGGPEKWGCLGARDFAGLSPDGTSNMTVMYWRSYDHLLAWSRDRMAKHFPGWKGLHEMGKRDANIGFWHETYFVKSGQYESIYINCPPMHLGDCAGAKLLPATGAMLTSANRFKGAGETTMYTGQVVAEAEPKNK